MCLSSMVFALAGCVEFEEAYSDGLWQEDATQTRTMQPPADAVYHPTTDSWIAPRKDSYALDNMQRACDNLLSGRSASAASSDIVDELSRIQLTATHYNVKIYPKTEAEQMRLETAGDIVVSYIPFDYVQLADNITGEPGAMEMGSEAPRYTETHDDFVSEAGPVEPFTVTLPVMYAVWPCDKQFPADMDYEILGEVFIPEEAPLPRSGEGMTPMQLLEREAIELAFGRGSDASPRFDIAWAGGPARGKVFNSDNLLHTYVPVPKVKIRYQLGSKVWEAYTNTNGEFGFGFIPADANLYFIFQTDKWKLTTAGSTAAYTLSRGTHRETFPNADYYGFVSIPVMETHRAINFYYNSSHSVPTYFYESGIRVIILDTPTVGNTDAVGLFTYSTTKNAYITIADRSNAQEVAGTVLHEFGHWTHYGIKEGKFNAYDNIHKLIRESWASYVGWYLGELYYTSLGWAGPAPEDNITGQSRQWWNPVSSSWYSPLFVDLRDDFNQNGRDQISGVPFSTINDILRSSTDWPTCRAAILSRIGSSYPTAILDSFLAPYDGYIDPKTFRITPNPVTGNTLTVTLGGEIFGSGTIKIYDMGGRQVYSSTRAGLNPGLQFSITLPSLSPGTYTLVIAFAGNGTFPSGQTGASFLKR